MQPSETEIVKAGAGGGVGYPDGRPKAWALGRALDAWTIDLMIDAVVGRDEKGRARAKYAEELRQVASELAGPDPTPSERLLAETAALDYFALRRNQAYYAGSSSRGKGLSLTQSDFQQRKIERSHKRLMASLSTLAAVRKLSVPAVQINLARQQVNVAGGAGSPRLPAQGAGEETP